MKVKFITKCCKCQKIIKTQMVEIANETKKEVISHGYCTQHGEEARREADEHFRKRRMGNGKGRPEKYL